MLLLAAVICIVLGMGMPTIGVYLLLATLVAPSLVEVGVAPIAAHLFILYFGMMSMITPPVAIAAFAAATLTNSDPMRTGFAAMRFGWLAFVIPFLFIASPSLLMEGTAVEVGLAFVTALGGVWLVSVGLMGHLFRSIGAVFRILYVAAVPGTSVSRRGRCLGRAIGYCRCDRRRLAGPSRVYRAAKGVTARLIKPVCQFDAGYGRPLT